MHSERYKLLPDFPNFEGGPWTGRWLLGDYVQGVAHDDKSWFFTSRYFLWKFPIGFDLRTDFDEDSLPQGVLKAYIPEGLGSLYYNHFNDFDAYKGFLLIPITSFGVDVPPGMKPMLVVFRTDTLTCCGWCPLYLAPDKGWASWCAINPIDGLLYTSGDGTSTTNPIHRYVLRLSDSGKPELSAHTPFPIYKEDKTPLTLAGGGTMMQGGVFSPNGLLYLVCSAGDESVDAGGIHVFDPDGIRVAKSTNGAEPFNFEFRPGLGSGEEEPEGITIWNLPTGSAPGISGQVHVILSQNIPAKITFKHYRIEPSPSWLYDLFPSRTIHSLALGQNADGRLEVFGISDGSRLSHVWQTTIGGSSPSWSECVEAGGPEVRQVVVSRNQDGRLEIFAVGWDKKIYNRWQTNPNNG